MKKIILSGITVFSLICPTLFIVLNQTAAACPVREPDTLLTLYKNSDDIYRARFTGQDESDPKPEKEDKRYAVTVVSRHFDVLTTLKGKNADNVTVYNDNYIYKPDPAVEFNEAVTDEPAKTEETPAVKTEDENAVEEEPTTDEAEEAIEIPDSDELKPGDEVLLFVEKDKESGRTEVVGYRDGLKQLSREDMGVYEARIKELGPIFAAEKPNPEKITDWLVRCAEDPATRWEGTTELTRSFRVLNYKLAHDAEKSRNAGESENIRFVGYGGNSNYEYAEAINEYHRQTLTNLLITGDLAYAATGKKKELGRGDSELVDLVTKWADTRVAQTLLERVRSGGYPKWENGQFMGSVARILKDEKLESLAGKYQDSTWRNDRDKIDENDDDDAPADEPVAEKAVVSTDQTASQGENAETIKEAKPEPVANKSPEPKKAKKSLTYGQRRKDTLGQFLTRADKLIFEPETSAEARKAGVK